nr:MAG TPA: hypothetical protein [Caudoviricetes sp.]
MLGLDEHDCSFCVKKPITLVRGYRRELGWSDSGQRPRAMSRYILQRSRYSGP